MAPIVLQNNVAVYIVTCMSKYTVVDLLGGTVASCLPYSSPGVNVRVSSWKY